jgi:all-trans-8'-apo-beta-carotenal 15,15'-oxygenase
VETPRVVAQRAAGEAGGFPVRGAWTQATSFWRNLFALPTNPSNTSALHWGGKLLALCEGGAPMELDPVTLRTRGTLALPSLNATVLGFGAHFKIDEQQRVLYNLGVQLPSALRVFALAADGSELAASTVRFPAGEMSFVHDWAMSGEHLVMFIPPWFTGPSETLASVAGLRALGHAFTWRRDRGTRCVVLRKRDLAVVHDSEVDAFSTYHFANAWEEGSLLKVHVNRLIGERDALEANFSDMYNAQWRVRHVASCCMPVCHILVRCIDASLLRRFSRSTTTRCGSTPSTWLRPAAAWWAPRPCCRPAAARCRWNSPS